MAHLPPPPHWPQISSCVFYRDPAAAIDWLCRAFGFEVRLKVEGEPGEIVHSELVYGQGLIMVSASARPGKAPEPSQAYKQQWASPLDLEGRYNQGLFVYVDDIEAHCAQARAHGARLFQEIETHDYGEEYWADRSYSAFDCEGHAWWFAQRLRTAA